MNIVILAAGKGVRMKSALPKVLHPLAGRPMLSHVLAVARRLSPSKLIVVVGAGGDLIRARFAADADVIWVEQTEQLGTGDAVRRALPALDDDQPTLVLYGDVPCLSLETLQRMIASSRPDALTLLTADFDQPTGYGRIVRNERGDIVLIVEEKDATDTQRAIREVNTGVVITPPKRLSGWLAKLTNDNAQGEYYLTDLVSMAVADGLRVVSTNAARRFEVEGANTFSQLARLERAYQRYLADALTASGVCVVDPDRLDIRGELTCGRDVVIDIGCVFEGRVVLGDNVTVGPYCVLRDVMIGENTQLDAYCLFEDARVGQNGKLGPFARLRPGASLADDVHIGNFVEVKNSTIDDGSKVNHLTYLGDADVGKRVNVGAGTITCNYDGAFKHRTRIEDDAFIGSDTQLVAPVTVGKGATLGAGTTLTKDAPANTLTLSRASQISLKAWKRPTKTKS